MRNALPMSLVLAVVAAGFPMAAAAQSLRCRNNLVSVGADKAEVTAACGAPAATDSYCKVPVDIAVPGSTQRPSINTVCYNVDSWTYRPGSGQLITTLKFESGKLRSIEYGSRIP